MLRLGFVFIFLLATLEQFDCDLVIIRANQYSTQGTANVLEVCSIYRGPTSYLGKYREPLNKLNSTFNPCNVISHNDTFSKDDVVYFKIDQQLDCDFKSVESSMKDNNVLTLVGLNDSVVLTLSNSSKNEVFQIPFLFLPNSKSRMLDNFLARSNSTFIELYKRETPFDVSILIVAAIGILTLLVGSLWHRYKFIKE